FGAWLSHWMFFLLGACAWALLLALGAELLLIARGQHRGQPGVRALGALCIALAFAGFHALLAPAWSSLPQGSGGVLAIAGVAELSARFGTLGAALWITLLGAIGLVVAFDHLVLIAPAAAARWT